MKKGLSILLVVMMLFTFVCPVYADTSAPTYTITVKNLDTDATSKPVSGHEYQAYQIFKGDVSGTSPNKLTLSNIEWGDGITSAGQTAVESALGTKGAADTAKKLASKDLTKEQMTAFQEAVVKNLSEAKVKNSEYVQSENVYKISVPAGYYLIRDAADSLTGKDQAYTNYLLKVAGNVTVTPKSSKPTVIKKVKDINDSANEDNDWQDSADYDIGDLVPFRLTATLGSLQGYQTYQLEFHDTLSSGLTFEMGEESNSGPDSLQVKVGDRVLKQDIEYTYTYEKDTGKLTVTIPNVLAYGAQEKTQVVVDYKARLNEKAVIGAKGNPNVVYLKYSNNPNSSSELGKTPEDKVIVFTYQLSVNKTDGEKPLEGAEFELWKNVKGTWTKVDGMVGSRGDDLQGKPTIFTWKGIDDGNYKLVETVAPDGYNKIEDLEFTISATHDRLADDPKLKSVTLKKLTGESMGEEADGLLSMNVVNEQGSILPETGGIGTTVFYVLGGILAVGAIVLLVAKRRAN